jgi:Uncharacterised protein family (UPF0158)
VRGHGHVAQPVSDAAARQRLARAVSGRGAFRRFKNELYEDYPGVSVWPAFRDARAQRRAVGWLLDQRLISEAPPRTPPPATPIPFHPDNTAGDQVPRLHIRHGEQPAPTRVISPLVRDLVGGGGLLALVCPG